MRKLNLRSHLIVPAALLYLVVSCSNGTQTTGTGGSRGTGGSTGIGGSAGSGGSSSTGGHTSTGGSGSSSTDTGRTLRGDACTIRTPTHWTAGVYVVDCKLDVASNLTIDSGVIVKFASGAYLDVLAGGTLTAVGTASRPIIFTSIKDDAHGGDSNADGTTVPARNDWGCKGSCGDLNLKGDGSVLDYVQDLYGSNGVYVQAASVQIKNSVFAHHNNYGLVLDASLGVGTTLLTGNAFFDNNGYPLRMGAPVFLDASNVFHDPANPDTKNAKQCIELDTDIDQLTMLGVTELGFLFSGHRIRSEMILAFDVIFKSRNDSIYLEASGNFINGPGVIFTSYKDDSLGGDCTGDGQTAPADGDWKGLWIDDGTQSGYAVSSDDIRYAANSGTMVVH